VSLVASAFDRATAVAPTGAGAWQARCDTAWSTPAGPNGGYLAAIVLRAMSAELDDPARQPRSLTCHYLRPPRDGAVDVEVAIERRGRSVTATSARLSQAGELCITALGAFAVDFDGALDYTGTPPDVPAPETLQRARAIPDIRMTEQFESRPALGARPFSGAGEALTGGWLRFADPTALDAIGLAMYADAWLPAPYVRVTHPVNAPTIDLTVHFRAPDAVAAVAPDEPVLAVFRSSTSAHGFFEEDGELWSRDGVLLAHSRQLALLVDGGR
jgi:acyl-CoA thioesterase